ncbi:hypothetical protein MNBD_GAMMA12-1128 [hydrothermal vent metagenome]|uniref:Lipoprotein n=1 Tax=hydrothermal vent metagenome TaxID=652676 RepID=A0A3B0Y887_9ZZZZ
MKKLALIALIAIFLSACQANVRSPLPTGTTFHLNEDIEFHPLQVAVYFQYGKIVEANSIDDYKSNCTLEVKHKLKRTQIFTPDSFSITRIHREITDQYKLGSLRSQAFAFGGASRYPEYITEIYLYSKRQSNIYKLTCQHLEEPESPRHLTPKDIQNTLGGIITITYPH